MDGQSLSLLKVLGFDPSLNNWGIASGTYDTVTKTLSIDTLGVINPVFTDNKQVRQNSKDLERARQLAAGAIEAAVGFTCIFVEVPVGSQSARAMASYGICVGVLGALRAQGIPFFEVSPTEVKMATIGKKTASKTDIINRAVALHPQANWPRMMRKGVHSISVAKAEHMADAIGAIEAGIHTEQFKIMLPFMATNHNPFTPKESVCKSD